jgi:general secretion pathway protein G
MSRRSQRGVTYVEIMATVTILMVVAAAVLPTARVANRRRKELELRDALRELRGAIDLYRSYCDPTSPSPNNKKIPPRDPPYPPDLKSLVEGVGMAGSLEKLKVLRRLPIDPMTGKDEWGLRCYSDELNSTSWCGRDVWDVYSKSTAKALDGTHYNEW